MEARAYVWTPPQMNKTNMCTQHINKIQSNYKKKSQNINIKGFIGTPANRQQYCSQGSKVTIIKFVESILGIK